MNLQLLANEGFGMENRVWIPGRVIIRFQLMYGLSADGIYGPKTKAKFESLLK
ncbi:hypothetical protein CHCC20497_2076 [Bacillus paralicheniformis]|nr:peptidoglycan-binding protein [Bacillus licheniformis]TWJ82606.1 hypothetical protein CHCC20497_2076 [Bacillus paralicheniformis]TWL14590.1 hypothetical protein CHCC16874_1633 [Bacillus licheniformis]